VERNLKSFLFVAFLTQKYYILLMIEGEPQRIWPKDEIVGGERREVVETTLQRQIEQEHPDAVVIFDGREESPTAVLDEPDLNYLLRLFRIGYY